MLRVLLAMLCMLIMPLVSMAQNTVKPRVAMALSLTFGQPTNHKVCSCTDPLNCTCGTNCQCANCLSNRTAGTKATPDLPKKEGDPLILASDGRYYPLSAWGSSGLSSVTFEPMRTSQPVIMQSGYIQPSLPVQMGNVNCSPGFMGGSS